MIHIILILGLLSVSLALWSVSYDPKTICVLEGSSVDFSCAFNYPDHLTVKTRKWFRRVIQDGTQISVYHSREAEIHPQYINRTSSANMEKNCSLHLENVSRSDMGKYFFRIETNYLNGKFTGKGGIKVNVAVLPLKARVKNKKLNENIEEGDSVTLICGSGTCSPPQESFVWFKNQHLLSQASKNELRISPVSHIDHGNYSCALKNSNMMQPLDEILLDVKYSPQDVEISISSSEDIREGNAVTLQCKSKANPAVQNYSWFQKKGSNVTSIGSESEFYIRSAGLRDGGLYFCMATNEMGSQKSNIFELKVKAANKHRFVLLMLSMGLCVLAVLYFIIRRKRKQSAEKIPEDVFTEDIYENLRKAPEAKENSSTVIYADLRLPPSTSDRLHCNSQEPDTVIYSLLNYN